MHNITQCMFKRSIGLLRVQNCTYKGASGVEVARCKIPVYEGATGVKCKMQNCTFISIYVFLLKTENVGEMGI